MGSLVPGWDSFNLRDAPKSPTKREIEKFKKMHPETVDVHVVTVTHDHSSSKSDSDVKQEFKLPVVWWRCSNCAFMNERSPGELGLDESPNCKYTSQVQIVHHGSSNGDGDVSVSATSPNPSNRPPV